MGEGKQLRSVAVVRGFRLIACPYTSDTMGYTVCALWCGALASI
jgi:peroxiredoxin family protein